MANDFGVRISNSGHQANPSTAPVIVGISWYLPETYSRCRAMFEDAHELPETYEEWLMNAEKVEKQIVQQGFKVVRAMIDPETFSTWCQTNGFAKIDKNARMAYGNATARR